MYDVTCILHLTSYIHLTWRATEEGLWRATEEGLWTLEGDRRRSLEGAFNIIQYGSPRVSVKYKIIYNATFVFPDFRFQFQGPIIYNIYYAMLYVVH